MSGIRSSIARAGHIHRACQSQPCEHKHFDAKTSTSSGARSPGGCPSMKRPPACTRCENKCFRVASIIAPGATTAGGGPARSARDVFIPIQALGFWPVAVVPASPLQTHHSAPPLPVHPVVLCLPAMQRGRPMQRARHQLWRGCRRWPSWKAAEAWKVATPRFHARSSEGAPLRLGTQAQQAVPAGAGAADAGAVCACCVRGVGVRCAWSRAATPESVAGSNARAGCLGSTRARGTRSTAPRCACCLVRCAVRV